MAVLIIIVAAVTSGSGSRSSGGNSGGRACAASYPDKQDADVCADPNGAVNLNGMVVTASAFASVTDEFAGKTLCTTVTFQNTTDKSQDYNEFDFKMQTPSGDVASMSAQASGGTLGSGTLVAGGTKTGKICATDTGQKGQYVFIYKPNPFESDRGIWLFTR